MKNEKDTDDLIDITDKVGLKAYISTDHQYLEPTVILRITHDDYDGGFNIGPMLSGGILSSFEKNDLKDLVDQVKRESEEKRSKREK